MIRIAILLALILPAAAQPNLDDAIKAHQSELQRLQIEHQWRQFEQQQRLQRQLHRHSDGLRRQLEFDREQAQFYRMRPSERAKSK